MLFRHKVVHKKKECCLSQERGAHNDTSKGISWNFRESFLTMTMSHVIVPCVWRFFYFWLRRLSTGEECWMIASIRILVWRRECRRNMLIRHWHFLFPPTTEIHTLKNYISHLYMSSIHDQHIILGTQERVLWRILGSQNYLILLVLFPSEAGGGIRLLIGERLQKGCERWQDVEAGADKMTPSKPWALTGVILRRSPSSRSSRSTM